MNLKWCSKCGLPFIPVKKNQRNCGQKHKIINYSANKPIPYQLTDDGWNFSNSGVT